MNWRDIASHVAVAVNAMTALYWFGAPTWAIVTLNTVIWPVRETWQHRPNYHEIVTRKQPLAEWLAPVATGCIFMLILPKG